MSCFTRKSTTMHRYQPTASQRRSPFCSKKRAIKNAMNRAFPPIPAELLVFSYQIIRRHGENDTWFLAEVETSNQPAMIRCRKIIRAIDCADDLLRFADVRQPSPERADREIGDFGHKALNEVFQHELRLLDLLHKESLIDASGSTWDYQDLCSMMRREPQHFMEDEREHLRYGRQRVRPGFSWLHYFQKSLIQSKELMIAAYRAAAREVDNEQEATELMDKVYIRIPAMTKLLIELLYSEQDFEETLAGGHIWDAKVEKRVRIFHPELASQTPMDTVFQETKANTRELKLRFRRYGLRMRDLYAHRYLVDWQRNRVWNKLHLVVGDQCAIDVDQDTVQRFLNWSTSGPALAEVLFGVHPIHKKQLGAGIICVICQEAYKKGDLLMELKGCKHQFHAWCVLRYWDQYHHYVNDCALCRQKAPQLQDRFPGFATMAQDVCYITDKDASSLADERDHLIRHRQRRGEPPLLWEGDLQGHFWERERIAWLEGASLESRERKFPRRRSIAKEEDSASSDGECVFVVDAESDEGSHDDADSNSDHGSRVELNAESNPASGANHESLCE